MYILRISPKAFIRQDKEIVVTNNYSMATTFDTIGDAMRAAAQINRDLEINKVHVIYL